MAEYYSEIHEEGYKLKYSMRKSDGAYVYALSGIEVEDGVDRLASVNVSGSIDDGNGPVSVVEIGANAFKGATKVVGVRIPDGVKSIGKCAFSGCSNLNHVGCGVDGTGIPSSVTEIGDMAFEGTDLATTPWDEKNRGLASLGKFVFHNCAGLKKACIPENLNRIGDGAFDGCASLEKVEFKGTGLTSIGKHAFRNCVSLSLGGNAILGNVKKIEEGAFEGCVSLKSVAFGENAALTSIGKHVFCNCIALGPEGVDIPACVEEIGDGAFEGCVSLKSVAFGENAVLTSIGNSAFRNCVSLEVITVKDYDVLKGMKISGRAGSKGICFPERLKHVGDRAFEGCRGLDGILWFARGKDFNDLSVGNFAFRGCAGLKSAVISRKSVKIGAGTFRDCGFMSEILIVVRDGSEADTKKNSEITSIGYRAFYGCRMLSRICHVNHYGAEIKGTKVNVRFLGDEAFHGCERLTGGNRPGCTPYTTNQDAGWHGRIGVAGEIEKFMRVYDDDEFSRYRAYDYVHEKFREYARGRDGRSSEESAHLFDELRLPQHLHTFLASWGMLRGSSFLLYKNYRFLKRACEIVCEERFAWLMDVDPFALRDGDPERNPGRYIRDILELKDEITYCFEDGGSYHKPGSVEEPIDSVSDTLISKILLAALGCIPAYDTYVTDALNDLDVVNTITGEGLCDLLGFVTGYTEIDGGENRNFSFFTQKHEKVRKGKETYGGTDYSVMKYVDMALWGFGYRVDGNDEDES